MMGSAAFVLFGLVLLVIGGRLIVYDLLLSGGSGEKIIGEITDAGSVHRSSGGYVNYIRYRFQDASGDFHTGQSSGYSGKAGETILLEYSPTFPFIHRVSGEGKNRGYRFRWPIAAAGLLFAIAGIHWFLYTRGRIRLGNRLSQKGIPVTGKIDRITYDGKVIEYSYQTDTGTVYRGKSLPLPLEKVKQLGEGDSVEVLYDPLDKKRSILKMEVATTEKD